MWRLVKTECYKLIKSESYRRLLVVCILITIASLSQDRGTKMGFFLTGYEWFCVRQLMMGWVIIPLSFFVAEHMAAEFSNHGFVLALICGYTRKEIFRAKAILCVAGVLGLAWTNTAVGLAVTIFLNGFGAKFNVGTAVLMIKSVVYYDLICIVFVGAVSILAAMITKNRIGAFGAGFCVCKILGILTANIPYIIEQMKDSLWKRFIDCLFQLTPLYQIDSLLSPQEYQSHPFWLFLLSCSVCIVMTYLLSLRIFQRIDIK